MNWIPVTSHERPTWGVPFLYWTVNGKFMVSKNDHDWPKGSRQSNLDAHFIIKFSVTHWTYVDSPK